MKFKVRDDDFIFVSTYAVAGNGWDGGMHLLLDGDSYGFCYQRWAAKGRAGLNEEGNVRVRLLQIVALKNVLHGFAGVLNADAIGGENLFGGFVIDRFRLFHLYVDSAKAHQSVTFFIPKL